tara:strand:+ start:4519 stop:5334 length:816 start_codon:yes stop_codon:yes gene_type:complete
MSIKDPVEINVSLDVNKTLKSTEEMAKAIEKADPRTNTYMPLSAGIESTAALVYAAKDPNLHAFCVHWYEQRYGMFADAMAFYTQKQAEYFNLPYGNDMSMLSLLPHTKEVPIIVSGLSAFMSVVTGQPGGFKLKYFMMGANSEDDMRMRLQFREYRKICATYLSDSLDGSGVKLDAVREVPQIINPLDFLTKAELYALIVREAPEMLDLIWTCFNPQGTLKEDGKVVGYVPCGKCYKCMELEQAKRTAADAVFRLQEGEKYFSRILKDME